MKGLPRSRKENWDRSRRRLNRFGICKGSYGWKILHTVPRERKKLGGYSPGAALSFLRSFTFSGLGSQVLMVGTNSGRGWMV
jgi:hypothetical protein